MQSRAIRAPVETGRGVWDLRQRHTGRASAAGVQPPALGLHLVMGCEQLLRNRG